MTSTQQTTEAIKHGQLPSDSGQAPPDHPGSWEDQINRASYLFQSGQQPDPAPDHGGKGYEYDPEALPDMIKEYSAMAEESNQFSLQLQRAKIAAFAPAPDRKSKQHAKDYKASLDKAIAKADGATAYLRGMVADMNKALASYQQTDEQASQNIRRTQA